MTGLRLTMLSVMAALTHRCHWQAMLTWKAYLEEHRQSLATIRCALAHAQEMSTVRALNKWEQYWSERHNYRQAVLRCVRFSTVSALRRWRAACVRSEMRLRRIECKARELLVAPSATPCAFSAGLKPVAAPASVAMLLDWGAN